VKSVFVRESRAGMVVSCAETILSRVEGLLSRAERAVSLVEKLLCGVKRTQSLLLPVLTRVDAVLSSAEAILGRVLLILCPFQSGRSLEQRPFDPAIDRKYAVVCGDDHFAFAGEAEADDIVAGD